MDRHEHWQHVYATNADDAVSWFEATPATSLRLIDSAGFTTEACVLDVGGGASRLVDALVERGVRCLAVLDISETAIARAKTRLGTRAGDVTWIAADVTGTWSWEPVDIWHDRAVFHFLVDPEDRRRYVSSLQRALKPRGSAIIATFAPDGPERCSGLPICRYAPEALAAELGAEFRLVDTIVHTHRTPGGALQSFQYSRFERTPSGR